MRVRCGEERERSVLILRVALRGVLFDHEAADGAQLNHILLDRFKEGLLVG